MKVLRIRKNKEWLQSSLYILYKKIMNPNGTKSSHATDEKKIEASEEVSFFTYLLVKINQ